MRLTVANLCVCFIVPSCTGVFIYGQFMALKVVEKHDQQTVKPEAAIKTTFYLNTEPVLIQEICELFYRPPL